MVLKKYKAHILFCASAFALISFTAGCGQDPGMYQGETLTFETPVSAKTSTHDTNKKSKLDLGADESMDFHFTRLGAYIPWGPYPLYDYYRNPIAVEVPVSPWYSLVDYVHPFYAYTLFNPFVDDDDYHRYDDDDN